MRSAPSALRIVLIGSALSVPFVPLHDASLRPPTSGASINDEQAPHAASYVLQNTKEDGGRWRRASRAARRPGASWRTARSSRRTRTTSTLDDRRAHVRRLPRRRRRQDGREAEPARGVRRARPRARRRDAQLRVTLPDGDLLLAGFRQHRQGRQGDAPRATSSWRRRRRRRRRRLAAAAAASARRTTGSAPRALFWVDLVPSGDDAGVFLGGPLAWDSRMTSAASRCCSHGPQPPAAARRRARRRRGCGISTMGLRADEPKGGLARGDGGHCRVGGAEGAAAGAGADWWIFPTRLGPTASESAAGEAGAGA